MDYDQALEVVEELTRFGINLGLTRITAMLDLLDNPQDKLQVVHIGGTNGKGSTAAMLAAVLREAGYRVGTYTSPHLVSYTERYVINGKKISPEDFADLVEELIAVFAEVKRKSGEAPTQFEVLTALAFLYFYRQKVDILLLEVGLGGDIDSTNVVKKPLLSVITNVSMEHEDYLGSTLEEIAAKKSGIIKKECPVVTASAEERVLGVLRERARKLKAPLYEVSREVSWRAIAETDRGQVFSASTQKCGYGELSLSLWGEHQIVNAATAILSLEILTEKGFWVSREQIRKGLVEVVWPGRLELISIDPVVIIDGAHNPAGMAMLAKWLKRRRKGVGKVILVIGMLADKDRSKAASSLDPLVDSVYITKPLSPRAGEWRELAGFFSGEKDKVKVVEELSFALKDACQEAESGDMVLVTGSLYLIGEARSFLLSTLQR